MDTNYIEIIAPLIRYSGVNGLEARAASSNIDKVNEMIEQKAAMNNLAYVLNNSDIQHLADSLKNN